MLWTPWYPLNGASRNQDIPRAPGLYRIRRADIPGLDYVGQTGVLRQRMGNLNNVYGDVMPYNGPHTAGPPKAGSLNHCPPLQPIGPTTTPDLHTVCRAAEI